MVSQQTIKVIIEAEEKISKVAKQAEKALDRLGTTGSKGMNAINKISSKAENAISKMTSIVNKARNKFNELRNSGESTGSIIKQGISSAANAFGKLITNSNTAKLAMEKIKSVSNGVQGTITNLKNKITSFGSSAKSAFKSAFSLTNIKAQLSNLGNSIDKIKLKLKELSSESRKSGNGLGFLTNAASMAVGMIGYDLVNSFIEAGRAAINASGQLDYFAGRLKMSEQQSTNFRNELTEMQKDFKKVNMTAVGATAEDLAARYDLPINKLGDLTRMTAVMSSEFIRNGRSQEDAVLAVADAMDGQFKKLQEIGITQETLKKNGWNGSLEDQASLIDALNKSMEQMGYDKIAKDITNLDDAYQALTVAGGQLLEKVLIPITPYLIQIVDWAISLADALGGVIDFLSNNGWAQGVVIITGLAIGFGLLAGAIAVAAAAEGGMMALMPGFITSLYGAASGFMAITVAGAPLWAIVAVVAAIAIAVYEVGIAFGWWSDIGSMLEAIGAGVTRLWNAFINHPDVQAAISAISDALSWLWDGLVSVGQSLMDFFGIATGGDFDIVRALIDSVGAAWDAIKAPIEFVIGLFTAAGEAGNATADAFSAFWNDTLAPFGEWLGSVFAPVWQLIGDLINAISPFVNNLMNAFNLFASGQMSLPDLILTVLTTLYNAYVTIFSMIVSRVTSWGSSIISKGVSAITRFVNGIVNRITTLPGKIYTILLGVVSKIVSAIQSWIDSAKKKAQGIVDGVGNVLSKTKDSVVNALKGVADAIAKPFEEGYKQAKKWWDDVTSLNGGHAAGGYDIVAGGMDLSTSSSNNGPIEVNINEKLTLDLINVPSHIDENALIQMMTDKKVLRAFTSNKDFQTLDLEVKNEINKRLGRARGV